MDRSTTANVRSRGASGGRPRFGAVVMAFVLVAGAVGLSGATASNTNAAAGCRIYVASGDDVTNGKAMAMLSRHNNGRVIRACSARL